MNDAPAVVYVGSLMEGCMRLGMMDEWRELMLLIRVEPSYARF